MRLSPCLVVAGLSTGVHAFYPWELKIETSLQNVQRRFMPWTLLPETSEDESNPTKPLTLDVRKFPVRREYTIVEANTPTLPNSAPLDQDGMDFSYFAAVQVGSQSQEMWLALDTGSPSSWVFGTSCTDPVCTSHHTWDSAESSTYVSKSATFTVGYGSGTVHGSLGQDTMSIAGLDVTFPFGSASSASKAFASYPLDGILGLGRSDTGGWDVPSFMDVVAQNGMLSSNIVGFSLSRASDDPKDGEVNFGGINTSKFVGDISYTATNADTWTIPLDDAYVDGQACDFSSKSATIDTGTTYILIPPADAATLFALIPGSYQSGKNYIIPCNSTATVEFEFSGVKYSISPDDYIGATSSGGCVSTIVGHQSSGPDTWLVGDVFLKNVYSVFDYDNARIGFGARSLDSTSQNATTVTPSGTVSTAAAAPAAAVATATTASESGPADAPAAAATTGTTAAEVPTGGASRLSLSLGSLLAVFTTMLLL